MAIVREGVFNFFRIGSFEPLLALVHNDKDTPAPIHLKIPVGLFCGVLGGFMANPIDLLKIRMQAFGGATGFQHKQVVRRVLA